MRRWRNRVNVITKPATDAITRQRVALRLSELKVGYPLQRTLDVTLEVHSVETKDTSREEDYPKSSDLGIFGCTRN